MTLILNGTDNSATTPAVTGTDTDTGIYYPTSNQVAISTAGTQAMLVNASQNVGIGTATPVRKLTVSTAGTAEFVLQDTSQAADSRNWRIFNAGNTLYFGTLNDAGTAGTDAVKITSGANLQFNSGYGSVATAYGCRAWCQYNNSQAIVGSANISSITVNGTGDIRLNFATAMPDGNFSAVASTNEDGGTAKFCNPTQPSTTSIRVVTYNIVGATTNNTYNFVAVFR